MHDSNGSILAEYKTHPLVVQCFPGLSLIRNDTAFIHLQGILHSTESIAELYIDYTVLLMSCYRGHIIIYHYLSFRHDAWPFTSPVGCSHIHFFAGPILF